ncbi:hypothetical protein EV148_101185 [Dokdonella fugitiva]|jgi:ketosteroid isomerase-like protein|uniref:Ketosteroid isomerase-like protein n=2 Tax=Dokdonella fugitiva TaxID=328517 RepID=A0A4R2IG16_9GAMM|nr:hypothetical protein EV148_101185 [Dokdonella fugitiva]
MVAFSTNRDRGEPGCRFATAPVAPALVQYAPLSRMSLPMLAALLVTGALGATSLSPDLAAVVAAERGFALDAHRFGTRLAFLAHFDADAWLLRPTPVPALPALARDPDDGRLLEWGPKQVAIAASGELAVSTGPWAAHAAGATQYAHGHFLTFWKRGADGIWRVQADAGVGHPTPAPPTPGVTALVDASATAPLDAAALAQRRIALENADDALRAALARDPAHAFDAFADPALHAMRDGQLPADGAAALELVRKDASGLGRGARRALDLSASGDFAYTLGGDPACVECGSYMRAWHWRDGAWKLLVDLSLSNR